MQNSDAFVFWSVDTPGGSILLAPCQHPDSPEERPDVPLDVQCPLHARTVYYCADNGVLWCDGAAPGYVWHDLVVGIRGQHEDLG